MFDALKNINFSKLFSGTHKVINIVNKAIPVYKQIKPNIGSIRSLFNKKIDNEAVDEIKESRPIKLKRITSKNNFRSNSNDSLTFFQ